MENFKKVFLVIVILGLMMLWIPQLAFAGYALDFDGSDDYVNCGDINDIDDKSYLTIEAWVNWQTLDRLSTIVSKRYK